MSNTLNMVGAGGGIKLVSIAVARQPNKIAYKAGESFDPSGMIVQAVYSNGATLVATGWSYTPNTPLSIGDTKITILYTEGGVSRSVDQAISVTRTALPVPSQSGSLTYTGSSQSPVWDNYDSDKMTLGGVHTGVGAGSYNATFTLKDTALYCWVDGSVAMKTISWRIDKAAGTLSLNPTSLELNAQLPSTTFEIITNSTGAISVSSSSDIVSVSRTNKVVTVTNVASKSGTAIITVSVAEDSNYTSPNNKDVQVTCSFVSVYGVSWDGTSSSRFSRTDDAAGFVDPVAAISNGNGSSPFDNLMPWSGMHIVEDDACGTLVSIPKFWFKWTKTGTQMTLQIADAAQEGFNVSPAHADRGDGKGERDVVYVGRYHCDDNYKSTPGIPRVNTYRDIQYTNIHALDASVWAMDYQMYWTIAMLYLVEYADWNIQATIGYGCGNGQSREAQGVTDSMTYHTGTSAASRSTGTVGVQYRHIEGLWSNINDWLLGIYVYTGKVSIRNNPAEYLNSDETSETIIVSDKLRASGTIKAWAIPTVAGYEFALYPDDVVSGARKEYSCDRYYGDSYNRGLCFGGRFDQVSDLSGLFNINCGNSPAGNYANIGARLQKLP